MNNQILSTEIQQVPYQPVELPAIVYVWGGFVTILRVIIILGGIVCVFRKINE